MKPIFLRDQVHGDIRLDPMATALLDTPQMQRLGRVYQLGFAHLVYRGGNHTRLSHVIGTYHVAKLIVNDLRYNYTNAERFPLGAEIPSDFLPFPSAKTNEFTDARWDLLTYIVGWAALLHDIAHVPMGHTLEDEFDNIYVKHDDYSSPRIQFLWDNNGESDIKKTLLDETLYPDSIRTLKVDPEKIYFTVLLTCLYKEKKSENLTFAAILDKEVEKLKDQPDSQPGRKLLEDSSRKFVALLQEKYNKGSYFIPYMADIVGDTICADYLDYIMRDPLNVGLDILRDKRVLSKYFIGKDKNGLLRMALSLENTAGKPRLDTCSGVVDLVRQRFRFAEIIYYHKTKVSASAMLAKIFSLLGTPSEVAEPAMRFKLADIEKLTEDLINSQPKAHEIKSQYLPNSILDTSIGDESLLLWLKYQAWDQAMDYIRSSQSERLSQTLQAITLLDNVIERRLYKVMFSMDANLFGNLRHGSQQEVKTSDALNKLIKELRTQSKRRSDIETNMCKAAGLPNGSFILYVPPRKVQAKGIETGALDKGEVVTLEDHSTVKPNVEELNASYVNLWKMLVFVTPEYQDDDLALSKAIDVILAELFAGKIDFENNTDIKSGAWFEYISPLHRRGAALYSELCGDFKHDVNWKNFWDAKGTVESTTSPEDQAYRAILMDLGSKPGAIRANFSSSGTLELKVKALVPEEINFESASNVHKFKHTKAALIKISKDISDSQSLIK